jgi:hypothetical protein
VVPHRARCTLCCCLQWRIQPPPAAGPSQPGAAAGQLHHAASTAAAPPTLAAELPPSTSKAAASAGVAAPRQYSSPYHFDTRRTDSFPARNLGCPHPVEELYASCAGQQAGATAAGQHPLGWVPVDESELSRSSAGCFGGEAPAAESRLPLELFDSPELEFVSPEDRLGAGAGAQRSESGLRAAAPLMGGGAPLPERAPGAGGAALLGRHPNLTMPPPPMQAMTACPPSAATTLQTAASAGRPAGCSGTAGRALALRGARSRGGGQPVAPEACQAGVACTDSPLAPAAPPRRSSQPPPRRLPRALPPLITAAAPPAPSCLDPPAPAGRTTCTWCAGRPAARPSGSSAST